MCLARMQTPSRAERHEPKVPSLGLTCDAASSKSQLAATEPPGAKLATLDWPPPPSPAAATRPAGQVSGNAGLPTGAAPDLEATDAAALACSAAAGQRARGELWQIRADIEREKLRMVAPYPFFGCPMRFEDDYAALQITDDGRFSFSEVSLEPLTSMEAAEGETNSSKSRAVPLGVKHVVTYEGVFSAPHFPTPEEEDLQGTLRARTPGTERRPRGDSEGAISAPRASASGSKPKEPSWEDQSQTVPPEIAAIEAMGLVRHQIIEANGRWRLVSVDRGEFRFVITVCPFFHPNYATVKVLSRRAPGRSRRLPFVQRPYIPASIGTRSSKFSGPGASGVLPKGIGVAGHRPKGSRFAALLPAATLSAAESSPFKRAAAGSLATPQGIGTFAGRQRGMLGSYSSMPHLQKPQSVSRGFCEAVPRSFSHST